MRVTTRFIAAAFLLAGSAAAFAHGGHGIEGSHWHATDSAGFLVVVVLATIALWLSRDK